MTSKRASEESRKDIKDTFALFDSDHDGKVSKDEIGAMMRALGYLNCSKQLDAIVSMLDKDGNGYVDYEEFESFALRVSMKRQDSIDDPDFRAAFDMMDMNKDGVIDQRELKYFMTNFCNVTAENAEKNAMQTILDADENGDGKISYKEYVHHMKDQI